MNLVRSMLVSDPAAPLARAELDALIEWSDRGHPAHGLTGLLLFAGGHVLQVLEGPAEAVAMAEQVGAHDGGGGRRRRMHRVTCDVAGERMFDRWAARQLRFAALPGSDQARLRWLVEWAADPTVAPDPGELHGLLHALRRRSTA